MKKQMDEIISKLESGLMDLFNSNSYKEYLKVMSKFHNYSFNNSLLIALQKPDATYVAGYNTWKNEFQRYVKHGEQGIRIIAPAPYKSVKEEKKLDPKTNEPIIGGDGNPLTEQVEVIIPSYRMVSVFDVSQTTGKDLPRIAKQLNGDIENYDLFIDALNEISPVPIYMNEIRNGANGYYHNINKEIHVRNDMSQQQTMKTMIHEISHSILHDKDTGTEKNHLPDIRTKEVEAESVAYVVCNHFGIDTSDYSFGYIAGWSSGKDIKELKNSMNIIRETSAKLINTIEKQMEILKEQSIELKYYFSECGEIHSMGEYKEFDSLYDAIKAYKEFNDGISFMGGKELGFMYYSKYNKLYNDTGMSLFSGNRINSEMINSIEEFRKCKKIQDAMGILRSEFSNAMKENILTKTDAKIR